jgi:hypothetical protein
MSEKPDRILAWLDMTNSDEERGVIEGEWTASLEHPNIGTEYISAAAHRAELEKLREACAMLAQHYGGYAAGMICEAIRALDIDAALGKEPHDDS